MIIFPKNVIIFPPRVKKWIAQVLYKGRSCELTVDSEEGFLVSTIIVFCHNRDDHDYHDDSEEGLLVNVQTVVIPIMNIEILWMEGLEIM